MHPRRAPFRSLASASLRVRPLIAATLTGALALSSACRREKSRRSATASGDSVVASSDSARPADAELAAVPRGPTDVAALLARVLELGTMPDADARRQALATFLAGLGEEARGALFEALWKVGDDAAARARFAELFSLWCEADPAAAARWAVELWDEIPGRDGEKLREEAGFAWMKRDFDAAFAWALTLRDVGSEWSLAAKILKEVALIDPRRALALARGVSDAFYLSALNRIFAGWVEHDPAAAFAELGVACKDSSMFPYRLGQWADRDPVAATRWGLANASESLSWLAGCVQDKGAFVMAVYEAKLDWPEKGNGATSTLSSFLHSWAGADAESALAWLATLPAGEEKTELIRGAAGIRSYDEEKNFRPVSVPLILLLPEGAERDRLLGWHLAEWSRSDSDAALRWVQEHAEAGDGAQEAALTGAISALAKKDPKAAEAWLDATPAGEVRARAEREMAAGWASSDPVAAAAWLSERQPDWLSASWGSDGIDQKYRIAAGWMDADPDALFAWAAKQPDRLDAGYTLGNAISTLVSQAMVDGGDLNRPVALLLRLSAESPAADSHLASLFANMLNRSDKGRAQAEAVLGAQPGLTPERRREILAAAERELSEWKASGLVR